MVTIRTLSRNLGVPAGALVRYVLAKYATGGSGGLLELGPTMVHRLWEPIERAEEAGSIRGPARRLRPVAPDDPVAAAAPRGPLDLSRAALRLVSADLRASVFDVPRPANPVPGPLAWAAARRRIRRTEDSR